jgi:hypothetical protein
LGFHSVSLILKVDGLALAAITWQIRATEGARIATSHDKQVGSKISIVSGDSGKFRNILPIGLAVPVDLQPLAAKLGNLA